MEDDKVKSTEEALTECEETVDHLQKENAELRRSAQTFGDLAERLNANRRVSEANNSGQSSRTSSS